jgi:nucleotide-binding universal stress UspA family protein
VKEAKMFNRLLVPLDGSELAETVLPHVAELGTGCASEIILLQIIPPPGDGTRALFESLRLDMPVAPRPELIEGRTVVQHPIYREQEMASLRAAALRSLTRAKKRLGEAGVEARVEVLFGRPAEKIVEYALGEHVDLIAMVTHGRGGFRRRVFGAVAEKVLRTTALPVLLVRPPGARESSQLPAVELEL